MTQTDAARLIAVLREPATASGLDGKQWSELIGVARKANLLGTLAERLNDAGVVADHDADRHLRGARQLGMRQRRSVLWEAHCLEAALGDLQVPIMLLKGAAYVMSGHAISQGRLFGDIDILVPRTELGAVESRLMLNGWVGAKSHAYDQRYYREWMHELPPMVHLRRGTVLDVHHTILPLTARNAPDPDQIIARAVPLAGLPALSVPCPEDLLIHSITHLVHEGELHNGLRDLNDIDGMVRSFGQAAGFWTRLTQYAAGNDLAWPVCFGLRLARRLYGTPVPDAVMAELSPTGRLARPAGWREAVYVQALEPQPEGGRAATTAAQWLVYARAHALRMPLHLLVYHLGRKALLRFGMTGGIRAPARGPGLDDRR
jgi:hypothetical protein